MTTTISRRFYQDTHGQGYEAVAYYSKGSWSKPRGYYVSVIPVEVSDCGGGILSFHYENLMDHPLWLVEEVSRKSKAADARAEEALIRKVLEYFEDRDLAARLCSASELAS